MSHYGVARRKCGSPEWCYKALLREGYLTEDFA